MKQKQDVLVLPLESAQKVINYLTSRPYAEVAGLVQLFNGAKTATIEVDVNDQEQKEEKQAEVAN